MSVIKVNNITNLDGTSGPVIAGITTVSSTSHLVVPTGSTGQRVALAQDPFINNLVLALPFNNESRFTDTSPKGKGDPSIIGNTNISTAQSKYYDSSTAFDGTGDYLTFAGSSDFAFGTENFTIEFWIYSLEGKIGSQFINTNNSGGEGSVIIGSNSSNQLEYYNNATRINDTTSFGTNAWIHVALCRSSGTSRLFKNGTQVGSNYTDTINCLSTNTLLIAVRHDNSTFTINGYLQDLRIYKGVAKYTSNFTPPTQIAL